jgi:hypothetical protein
MDSLKVRLAATELRLRSLKAERKQAATIKQLSYRQNKANRERKLALIGEAVPRKLERGEWSEEKFRAMMDSFLTHSIDRELFELD